MTRCTLCYVIDPEGTAALRHRHGIPDNDEYTEVQAMLIVEVEIGMPIPNSEVAKEMGQNMIPQVSQDTGIEEKYIHFVSVSNPDEDSSENSSLDLLSQMDH